MNQTELEQAVLEFVNRPNYKPVKPRIIAKRLGFDEAAAVELKRTVKRLMKSGRLAYGQDHLVLPAATTSRRRKHKRLTKLSRPRPAAASNRAANSAGERVTGVFRRMNAGYGFVRPSGAAPAVDRSGDIFIAANHARDASSGDTVLVAVSRKRDIRRPESRRRNRRNSPARHASVRRHLFRRRPAMATCRSTARCSRAPFTSAIPARRMPSPTTKSCSKWCGFPRTFKMAKG